MTFLCLQCTEVSKDIINQVQLLGSQYGGYGDHGTEEARPRFIYGVSKISSSHGSALYLLFLQFSQPNCGVIRGSNAEYP